jgi:catechol 2,3-dioxygenase-like lactoylglutathione lyase family enzyme
MARRIGGVSMLVHDYDEAIDYYVSKAGFHLVEDTSMSDTKRWVVIEPKNNSGTQIILAKAVSEEEKKCVGNQGGGRVWLFLHTDDFHRDYAAMSANGVQFLEKPREEVYAIVAVFQDLYGNKWDLLQRK